MHFLLYSELYATNDHLDVLFALHGDITESGHRLFGVRILISALAPELAVDNVGQGGTADLSRHLGLASDGG